MDFQASKQVLGRWVSIIHGTGRKYDFLFKMAAAVNAPHECNIFADFFTDVFADANLGKVGENNGDIDLQELMHTGDLRNLY